MTTFIGTPLHSSPPDTHASTSCPCGGPGHLVQFYERDDFLVSKVADFLGEALAENGRALAIATAEHLGGIATRLGDAGFDVANLAKTGRWITFDAADTVGQICPHGAPDAGIFERVVGEPITRLVADGAPLAAFGEMVALLTRAGEFEPAMELEGLWNALQRRQRFGLLCAYPMDGFATSVADQRFRRVCQAHGRVLPTEAYAAPAGLSDEQLRQIAWLQQRAASLEAEIVERRRVEEKLRLRERELTSFVETASVGMHWVDADGFVLWANPAECEMLGYSKHEYIGRHLSEVHVDRAALDDILARLRRGESLRDREARLRTRDGTVKTVLLDSSGLWDGPRFVHSQCFTRDITAQRQAEQLNRHMAAIVAGSDDAILSKDLNGTITSWNPAAERMFGYGREEIVGQSITLLIPTERMSEEQMILGRLRRGERIVHYETVRRRKDGGLIEVSLTISPVKDASGAVVGASKIVRDITEKNAAQRALLAAKDSLAEMNRELEARVRERTASLTDLLSQMETFSYTVSHDLRAPLRSMAGFAEVLRDEHSASLSEEGREFLNRIIRASGRMNRLINDVLAYARVNRDRLEIAPVSALDSLRQVIQHAPEMHPPNARIRLPDTMPEVLGNDAFFTQIFANLLGNAVKFVAPGRTPEVEVTCQRKGDHLRIEIADNGIGIPPEQHGRLFGLFERLHVDKRYEGTGIGLAIVRRAIERMGGTIGVHSDGRNGSRFWLTLKLAASSSAVERAAPVNGHSVSAAGANR